MSKAHTIKLLTPFLLLLSLLSACSSQSVTRNVTIPFMAPEPIINSYINSKTIIPKRVAVLPFGYEKSAEIAKDSEKTKLVQTAEKILRRSFYSEFKPLGFEDLRLEEIDTVTDALKFRPHGFLSRKEILMLCEALGVDGLISGELTKATNLTEGVYAETVLGAKFWFWNRKGELLWTADHQEAFRGGFYDLGQAVDLVVNQIENQDEDLAFERQAARLSRKVIVTIPVSQLRNYSEETRIRSAAVLVMPFYHAKPDDKVGAGYLSSELASALIRRGVMVGDLNEYPEIKNRGRSIVEIKALNEEAAKVGIPLVVTGEVLEWKSFYGVLHSHVTCIFRVDLWDSKTGRRILSNTYDKSLAQGLIKGPTGIGAAALTPLTGLDSKKNYQNAWDLVERAASDVSVIVKHREKRALSKTGDSH